MAEKYSFVMGNISNDFLQLKTSDSIYLEDLLEKEVFPSLALYNERQTTMVRLLAYKYQDAVANSKQLFNSDSFKRLSDIEQPGTNTGFESWNRPIPIQRYGTGTKINMETLKQMSSKQIIEWHNAKMIADTENTIKIMFEKMCTYAPAGAVDELTHIAATPKAFWNNDGVDVPRPNGQITFANTHQHYLAVAGADSLGTSGAELTTLLSRVTEHVGMTGQPILWVRSAGTPSLAIQAETTYFRGVNRVSALFADPNPGYNISGFAKALLRGEVTLGNDVNVIGTWKNAVVIETPHMVDHYVLATVYSGDNSPNAPLAWREHPQFPGLMLASDTGQNPIIGKDAQYRRYLGMGVWERSAGAVLYTHNTSWVEPSFT